MNKTNTQKPIRKRVQIFFNEPSLTVQEFKDETDINKIVARARLTGELPQNNRKPQYGDFTEVPDYQTALNIIQEAEESFMSLPSKIRQRFGNDPGQLIDFMSNPQNEAEARALGLVDIKPSKEGDTPLKSKPPSPSEGKKDALASKKQPEGAQAEV